MLAALAGGAIIAGGLMFLGLFVATMVLVVKGR